MTLINRAINGVFVMIAGILFKFLMNWDDEFDIELDDDV
jgi:hypothetical protein